MSNRFFEGVVVGAVIGAGISLLLAPQSGKETRRLLRRLKDELGRLFVARGVVKEHAVALQLGLVAARHQVDEQPPAREAIKRGRHTRRQRRLVQAGAHGHQKLEVARDGQQAGRHHPRVFARAAGGDEHAFVAQAVGRHRDLLEVVVVELARTFDGAEVAAVAVGGDEPENFHDDL